MPKLCFVMGIRIFSDRKDFLYDLTDMSCPKLTPLVWIGCHYNNTDNQSSCSSLNLFFSLPFPLYPFPFISFIPFNCFFAS